jgi:putative drug exporter of the RND superfamily
MAAKSGFLGRIGRGCYRHRWVTVAIWLAGTACLITLWLQFGAAANNNFTGSDPGQTLLNEHFARQSGDTLTLAIRSKAAMTSPAVKARVTRALTPFRQAPDVTSVTDPYTTPGQLAADGHIGYASVQFDVPGSSISNGEATALMHDATIASGDGVTFSLGGDVVDLAETPYGGASNGIGVGAAAVVLLIAFGSWLAMGLPIATALLGIGGGLSLIALLGHVFPAPSFAPIVAALIGLGIGVDYALFIVTRFREELRGPAQREELRAGQAGLDAIVVTMRTAGRAVLTAGSTVVIGMLGLLVLRQSLLTGVAIAAAATVAMTVLAALTLLPALLGFTGLRLARPSRLNTFLGVKVFGRGRLGRRGRGGVRTGSAGTGSARTGSAGTGSAGTGSAGTGSAGTGSAGTVGRVAGLGASTRARSAEKREVHAAERWASVVQGHPVVAAVAAVVVIGVLAAPALFMKLSMPDESAQARGTMGYASYAAMAQGFGPGFDAPLIIAAQLRTGDLGAVTALRGAVAGTPGVAAVAPPVISQDGQAAMIIAYPTTGEQDAATNALVKRLQDRVLPRSALTAYVTGPNAANVSFTNLIVARLPWLIGVVVALSMVLLLVVFRSVAIAVKAAVMNLLSVCAAYGVLTAVTQWGWLGHVLGFPEKMPVTTWVPVFLFVILFGLSMDYEVFLLSKIREEYDRSGDNSRAVGRGLAATARVISAAAAIMVVVFLSFDLTPDVSVKQIGLGLAAAVLVDATVVRLVLVPAVMELLGGANWWLPGWLARLLPGGAGHEAVDATGDLAGVR